MDFSFKILTRQAEMLPFYGLFSQLNPAVSEADYASMLGEMVGHGYRMAVVFDGAEAVGLSGIWVAVKLYSGRYMELDNVVVAASHRSAGVGRAMTAFLEELALSEGCRTLMLDAYLENEKAHAFYEREGFTKRGYHFLKKIG